MWLARRALARWVAEEDPSPPVCLFCCAAPRTRLFHPCMHVCACDACASRLTDCPLCKQEIMARWRVYLS